MANPNFWANPTNQPAKLWNLTWKQVKSLHGAVWKSILIAFSLIVVMTLLNWGDHRGWNLALTIIGYVFIWWFGLRPTHLAYSTGGGIFATFIHRDASQGVASGPRALFRLVQQVSYTFLLIGFSLFTWNFSGNIGAFWVTMIGAIILTQTGTLSGGWRAKIITGYVAICIAAAIWTTFGTYSGRSFDPATGESLYMVDPSTGRIDSEGRTPKECAEKACFSAETGVGLVRMSKEEALKRNPAGIGDKVVAGINNVSLPTLSLEGGCPEKTIIVQPEGSTFDLKSGCTVTLDMAVIQQNRAIETGNPRAQFGAKVVRLGTNDPKLLSMNESEVFNLDTIHWENGRPMIKVIAQDFTGTVHLNVYDRNSSKAALAAAISGGTN